MEDEESGDTDNDVDDEQLKSDTSLDTRSSPWFLDNKDIESESRSYLSSSREDVYDSHTDGSLEDSTDNDRCSPSTLIAHENDSVEDGYSVKKGETYTKRVSNLTLQFSLSLSVKLFLYINNLCDGFSVFLFIHLISISSV